MKIASRNIWKYVWKLWGNYISNQDIDRLHLPVSWEVSIALAADTQTLCLSIHLDAVDMQEVTRDSDVFVSDWPPVKQEV